MLADLDTPLSVYLKLAEGKDSYLLESVEGGETWGRFSIIGLPCTQNATALTGTTSVHQFEDGEVVSQRRRRNDPLDPVGALQRRIQRAAPGRAARVLRRTRGLLRLRNRAALRNRLG